MDRRQFLRTSAAGAAAVALGPAALAARAAGVPAQIGIQLYTLRTVFPGDFMGVLDTLHRLGYRELEFAGYHDRSPETVRDAIRSAGLAAPSAHVPLEALEGDFDGVVRAAQTVGHRYVVVPWLAPERRQSMDDYRRLADTLAGFAPRMRAAGLQLGYHNHDFEFETFGGQQPAYELMLERLDPDDVVMELDLYWVNFTGRDPLDLFARYPGRFPLWHVKDAGPAPRRAMTDVGAGTLDWPALFAASEQAGLRHAFVERDDTGDPLATARASARYLESLRG